jgi:hypothetical protein
VTHGGEWIIGVPELRDRTQRFAGRWCYDRTATTSFFRKESFWKKDATALLGAVDPLFRNCGGWEKGLRHLSCTKERILDLDFPFEMPRICAFYGIDIYMYFRDHPPPHFHARYGDSEAEIEIETLEIIAGDLPSRAKRMVTEWAEQHQSKLQQNWRRARNHNPLHDIEPLD